MSRSRKKNPVWKSTSTKPWYWKRQASKAARKHDLSSGGSYKRVYNSWNICDYCTTMFTYDMRYWYYQMFPEDYVNDLRRIFRK